MEIIYHRLLEKDLEQAIKYYESKGGERLGERFFKEAEAAIDSVIEQPGRYHIVEGGFRRAPLKSFPYHFLYAETLIDLRFLILRNDRRHPRYGLSRRW